MSSTIAPPQTRMRFIFNPRSGHNARTPYLLEHARTFVAHHRLSASVVLTEHPRHATALAREAVADGCKLVVAIGGDGTLNEVAAGLIGTDAALGLVPCGSGNGLGRHLGIPNPGDGAFRNLLHGHIRVIDTGTVNGLPFFNLMGIGFDAEISARFNRLTRRGLPAYVATTLRAWWGYRPLKCTIHHDEKTISTEAFLLTVANSDQYGNDCYIAPGARVDDGQLDLVVLRGVNLLNAGPLAARLFLKKIDGSRNTLRLRGTRFEIHRPSRAPIHTDGEVHHLEERLLVKVQPRSLRVIVPPPR
jgi:diacylglycerol kinase (ATP)